MLDQRTLQLRVSEAVLLGIVEPDALRVGADGTYDGAVAMDWSVRAASMQAWELAVLRVGSIAVVLVGPPGAGKSTWLAANRRPSAVYFDATMTWPPTREQAIRIAREAGRVVELVVFKTPLEVCLQRNATRPVGRRVPESQVIRQWHELRDKPPRPREGVTLHAVE